MAAQITSVCIFLIVCSGADQRKYQSSASLAFVRGSHRWPVDSPHKGPAKCFHWMTSSIAHVIIIIIKSEVSTFPSLSYFSVVVCLRRLLHHILSLIAYTFRESRCFVFTVIAQIEMSANSRIGFDLKIVSVCLYTSPSHYHHYAKLSEDIEPIKCLSDIYFRVCKIRHILSEIHYTICGAVCFQQFTHFPCDDCENIYIYIYIYICLHTHIHIYMYIYTLSYHHRKYRKYEL